MLRPDLLPPTGQLLAFESAARCGSIARASEELHLTQSAVSKLIKQLEERVGASLFHRVRQRIVLTEAGRIYAADLRHALTQLSTATQRASALGAIGEVLNLAVLPTFGTRWLIPRLSGFLDANPALTLNMATRTNGFDFELEPFDLAIHYGPPIWRGAHCYRLFGERVVPVCSPTYRQRHRIESPQDLLRLQLLHQPSRVEQWPQWFAMLSIPTPMVLHGAAYEQFSMLAQASAHGLGVALLPEMLVQEEVASSRLVVLFDHGLKSQHDYHLVVPETRTGHRLVGAFADWLRYEASLSEASGR